MVLGRVVGGLAAMVLTGTAAFAQTAYMPDTRGLSAPVQPYVPADGRSNAQPQAFMPQDFRVNRAPPAAPATETRTGWTDHRAGIAAPQPVRAGAQDSRPQVAPGQPVDYRITPPAPRLSAQPAPSYVPQAETPVVVPATVQDSRPRVPAGVVPPAAVAAPPVVETRPVLADVRAGVVDPRIATPREERYIDYRPIDGRPYDFRPADYKPVDSRSIEYRSFDNKVQDQKVLDPRLKEKGPEIQTRLDCKSILYRAVECNYIDYKEMDPKLQDLWAKYPEVTLGVVPKEYAKETSERWAPLMAYLSREVGLKVTLKIANDYQSLIESQRAGLIHIAVYSPMAYARARYTGAKVEAFAVETNGDGTRGKHALVYSMARGAAPKIEDFRGKSLGLVDPNSVSGYSVPRFALVSQKVDPDAVLSRQVFTGSHENALVALSQGLVDYAVGEWTSDEDSTLGRLLARGALRNVDGTPMRRDDFRTVMKSDLILNSPVAYLAELPDDLKAAIRRAVLEAPTRERSAFEKLFDGKARSWETIDNAAFDGTVELVRFIDDARRQPGVQKQAQR